MKKIFIFCILICSLTSVSLADARNPVYLDLTAPETNENINEPVKQDNLNSEKPKKRKYNKKEVKKANIALFSPYENVNRINNPNFSTNFSAQKEKLIGQKSAIGVKYITDIKPELTTQSRTIYTKHQLTDKLSLGSSYKTNPMADMSEQLKGTMALAPEFKLTESTSLKSVYSKNLAGNSYSGEFQVKYKPFKDNRFDMNIGAGQTVYEDSRETSTKVNFGTNINF
ncbi:hypothetical protein IKQ26_00095 [bacterium]|nr:hypothetical protein [bacterium]